MSLPGAYQYSLPDKLKTGLSNSPDTPNWQEVKL